MFNCASISLLKYRYKLLEQNICAIHIGSLVRGKNYWGINITDLNEPILVIMSKRFVFLFYVQIGIWYMVCVELNHTTTLLYLYYLSKRTLYNFMCKDNIPKRIEFTKILEIYTMLDSKFRIW